MGAAHGCIREVESPVIVDENRNWVNAAWPIREDDCNAAGRLAPYD